MTIYEKHIKLQNEHIELLKQFKEQEDVINELKNTIERQEIMIDKMKNCENCGIKRINTGECENNNRYMTNDKYKCINCDMWILKED